MKIPCFKPLVLFVITTILISCSSKKENLIIKVSENLNLHKINDHSYIHISTITLESGSKYACNGFVYIYNKEAYIFDTPSNDSATEELIDWLQNDQNATIKGVVFNHFHRDCNEGMDIFKNHNIPCIASKKTAYYMQNKKYGTPDQLFENELELKLGDKRIINKFFGEAHTPDNIISYFPDDQVMYGGCMIKSVQAQKGNLEDANVSEWSQTVSNIKNAYPNAQIIIPGHGKYGGPELLEYTISLFNN